jgi:hypothetical protein
LKATDAATARSFGESCTVCGHGMRFADIEFWRLPVPYYGVNRCVAALCRVAANPMRRDSPLGGSYSLEAVIEFLVRRLRKQTLKLLWKGVTHIHFCEMEYAKPADFYMWRTSEGQLRQRYVKQPQPWGGLAERCHSSVKTVHRLSLENRPL